ILVSGNFNPGIATIIYKNLTDGNFTRISSGIKGVIYGCATWGDYDDDGFDDILVTGSDVTKLYHNNQNETFTETNSFEFVTTSSVVWGDFDNDNDLDFLLSYRYGTIIYENVGNHEFLDVSTSMVGTHKGS